MIGSAEEWDRLADSQPDEGSAAARLRRGPPCRPGMLLLLAAALGDLVALVAVCALALLALRALRHFTPLIAFPWSACLALLWWCATATVLVVVRRGTPGMIMAGVGFERSVPQHRVAGVLAVALLLAFCLGLPALLGMASPLLRAAGGVNLGLRGPD
jgi:hypothetical protein